MKKFSLRIADGPYKVFSPATAISAALFLVGAVVGSVIGSKITPEASGSLYTYVFDYLNSIKEFDFSRFNLLYALFNNFKYHLVVFILGFAGFGMFLIPFVSGVRGFFLSLSVSAFVRLLGSAGISLSMAAFGIQAVLTLPCLLILSSVAFYASKRMLTYTGGKRRDLSPVFSKQYLLICGLCFIVLFISALCEAYLVPSLLSMVY